MLTGGHEKKVRLFDLTRPDAEPAVLRRADGSDAHDGIVMSVIWDAIRSAGISAGEDKIVR